MGKKLKLWCVTQRRRAHAAAAHAFAVCCRSCYRRRRRQAATLGDGSPTVHLNITALWFRDDDVGRRHSTPTPIPARSFLFLNVEMPQTCCITVCRHAARSSKCLTQARRARARPPSPHTPLPPRTPPPPPLPLLPLRPPLLLPRLLLLRCVICNSAGTKSQCHLKTMR